MNVLTRVCVPSVCSAELKEELPEPDMVHSLPPPLFPPLDETGQPADLRIPAGLRPPDPARLDELRPSKVTQG